MERVFLQNRDRNGLSTAGEDVIYIVPSLLHCDTKITLRYAENDLGIPNSTIH